MVVCIIALVVFGILGIFSVSYRKLAKEAFDCVLRKVTFRKCHTALDKRLKSQITGSIVRKSPKAGKFIYRHFVVISWIFTILLIASFAYSGYSLYNYVKYGNCYGPESEGFCIFDPTGQQSQYSGMKPTYEGAVVFPDADDDPSIGPKDAPVIVIEFGCFRCQFTKKAESVVQQILSTYGDKIYYVYRDFPLSARHLEADIHAEAADCALEQGKYWEYHKALFEHFEMVNHDDEMKQIAADLGLNTTQFNECLDSRKYKDEVQKDFEDGQKAGIFGTPTFFINNRTIVGPQPFEKFKKIIDEELKK